MCVAHQEEYSVFMIQAAAAFMSQPNTVPSSIRHIGLGHILGEPMGSPATGSPGSVTPMAQPPTTPGGGSGAPRAGGMNHAGGGDAETDVQRLQEEINTLRGQVQKWEESWAQAKQVRRPSTGYLLCCLFLLFLQDKHS